MNQAQMSLSTPLRRGWDRMVRMLFRPFDLSKWLVVGFAAWLAGLAGGGFSYGFHGGGSSGSGDHWRGAGDGGDGWDALADLREGWEWVLAHELVAGLIVAGVLAALALMFLVLWVSSRGKFVFLDNVVHERAAIAQPWTRYRRAGNSLFFFRFLVGLACLGVVLMVIGGMVWLGVVSFHSESLEGPTVVAGVALAVLAGCLLALGSAYLFFFLDAYVVPLMHRYDLGVMAAWRRFFRLARGRWGWFLLSGLFVFVLAMAACMAIFFTGLMTCCLGFILLIVPYVGTVVLLPLIVTYRASTVEFLAQAAPELLAPEPAE